MKRRFLLGLVAWLGMTVAAVAQVGNVPAPGVTSGFIQKQSFAAVSIGLAPAASATDIFCIAGSASKTVKVSKVEVSGTAGTLITTPAVFLRRASVDTGGTAASTIANPANTIGKLDSGSAAATATLIAYTANPTINDTSPTYIRAGNVTLPTTAAGTVIVPLLWDFGDNATALTQQLTLRGAAEQACLNLQATSVSSGLMNISINWAEE